MLPKAVLICPRFWLHAKFTIAWFSIAISILSVPVTSFHAKRPVSTDRFLALAGYASNTITNRITIVYFEPMVGSRGNIDDTITNQ